MSLDLATGTQTLVAHSEFRRGMVNWAGVSGDWTVFTDQSHTQGDEGMDVLWRVVAVNPTLHVRKVLLSNGNKPDPWVPWLSSSSDYVFWSSSEPDPKHTAREWVFREGWLAPRTLLRHAALTPGSESIGAGRMVYLGPDASEAPGRHIGGDCWSVSLRGGTPVPLTHTGLANGCATDGTWVVWDELISPDASPPAEGRDDNPYELWAQRLDEQEPELLHRGYMAGGWPLAADGFALYLGDDGNPVVQDLVNPRSHLRMSEMAWDLGARVGDRLALPHPVGQGTDQYVDIVELSRS